MGSTTQRIGLYKPDRTDYVSVITDLNNNYDLIDAAFGDTEESIDEASADLTSALSITQRVYGPFNNVPIITSGYETLTLTNDYSKVIGIYVDVTGATSDGKRSGFFVPKGMIDIATQSAPIAYKVGNRDANDYAYIFKSAENQIGIATGSSYGTVWVFRIIVVIQGQFST